MYVLYLLPSIEKCNINYGFVAVAENRRLQSIEGVEERGRGEFEDWSVELKCENQHSAAENSTGQNKNAVNLIFSFEIYVYASYIYMYM